MRGPVTNVQQWETLLESQQSLNGELNPLHINIIGTMKRID